MLLSKIGELRWVLPHFRSCHTTDRLREPADPVNCRRRLPGLLLFALSSAAQHTSREIGIAVDMQGLTGDKPRILGCQKHRRSGDLFRLCHAAERDRARHLDDFRLAAAIARLGCIREPGAMAHTQREIAAFVIAQFLSQFMVTVRPLSQLPLASSCPS